MKTQAKYIQYLVLCTRVLLAWTFLSYGWGKLTNDQFGIAPNELTKSVNEIGLFKLSWYLFNQEPFCTFIGVSQIMAALLLLYHRTVILGAFMSIPILINILMVDITFIKMTGFYWRLSYYLFLDFAILWHDKEKVILGINNFIQANKNRPKYSIWAILALPFMAILLELIGVLPKIISGLLFYPDETLNLLREFPAWAVSILSKLIGH
jgi:uncharacterized membrane protein YphA (DoxX/SURF4 family)